MIIGADNGDDKGNDGNGALINDDHSDAGDGDGDGEKRILDRSYIYVDLC